VAKGEHVCKWCAGTDSSDCDFCLGTGYETEYTDVPVCPHCGAEQSTDDLHDHHTIDCESCGKEMDVQVDYDVTYTTRRHPEEAT